MKFYGSDAVISKEKKKNQTVSAKEVFEMITILHCIFTVYDKDVIILKCNEHADECSKGGNEFSQMKSFF